MRIIDLQSKRVFYLDPKLSVAGNRDSSFRTFYFEPKKSTNKVRNDAVHFVVGFEHAPRDVAASLSRGNSGSNQNTATERRGYNTAWKFTRWDLVDLSQFTVKLKAEFQASNRDMYRHWRRLLHPVQSDRVVLPLILEISIPIRSTSRSMSMSSC